MPITLERVSYDYAAGTPLAVCAVRQISCTINDGEFVGIMGGTGCGKTTLLQLMAGLIVPRSGRVLLDGADLNAPDYARALLRQSVGVLFQCPEVQLFETTVERDVAFGLKHSGLDRAQVARRVQAALETLGFCYEEIRRQSPLALSGGEKRRVAIAGVLVTKPKILLLDEPAAGLDPLGRKAFLELLAGLNRAGTTIIMVSHNADSVSEYARRVLVLQEGCLALDGPPELVFSDLARAKALSICAGQARMLAELLEKRGFPMPPHITRYETLLAAVKRGRKGGDAP